MSKKFLITLTGVTGHLRCQQNLIQDMKSSCPTFATTRWISMGKVLKWFKANRIRLFQHFSEKKPACTPSMEWWLVVIIIQGLVERIEKTFSAMQGTRTLVCKQRQLLTALNQDIKERCYIKDPMTDEESISFLAAVNNYPLHGFHLNNYCVLRQEVASSIDEVGSFVQLTMDGLRSSSSDADKEAHDYIISTIANFSLQLVSGISKCWSQLGSEFEQLRMFCGAIASIMPSTSSVESDLSLINWTKDPNWQSLKFDQTTMAERIEIKRNSKKKSGYEVEKRDDGFFYITAVPSKKSSIQPGDRVLEVNGVKHTEFKTQKRANDLFEMMVLDMIPDEEEEDE
ncbi:hypothetical protein IV203_026144 [Nitzschia inconspicua]|uniref:PDZ domain-containing protein n=1 Tax=Nitzschia inconspicua TaxID=303405 RepID=A0A9K3LJ70_9STRA|nr:hypothetical protein IV203_026144 [Nitzschia inconspicua]